MSTQDPDARLKALAGHLDPYLAMHLLRLLEADSDAHRYAEVAERAQRAEDLNREFRRQLDARDRQIDRLMERAS